MDFFKSWRYVLIPLEHLFPYKEEILRRLLPIIETPNAPSLEVPIVRKGERNTLSKKKKSRRTKACVHLYIFIIAPLHSRPDLDQSAAEQKLPCMPYDTYGVEHNITIK